MCENNYFGSFGVIHCVHEKYFQYLSNSALDSQFFEQELYY